MESGSFVNVGGAATDTYAIYSSLKKDGYDVELYGDYSKIDKELKCPTIEQIMDTQYDLFWLNSIRDFKFAERYRKLHKCSFMYTDRGNVLHNYSNAGVKKLLPKMQYRIMQMRNARTWLNRYVAITADQLPVAKRFFAGSKTRITYIPIAPHDNFKRLDMRRDFGGAITIARLDERQKRISFMIEGISEVISIDHSLAGSEMLRIVGEGRDEPGYRSMVRKLGLERNITFHKFVVGEELVRAYNNAGFFVSSSEWESPGRVFMEAMACGLPLLINDRINSLLDEATGQRTVKEGYNGAIYKYRNRKDFALKFIEMYSNYNRRDIMSRNALQYIEQFKFSKFMERYKSVIDPVMKKRAKKGAQ